MGYTYETAIAKIVEELNIRDIDITVCNNETAKQSQETVLNKWGDTSLGKQVRARFQKRSGDDGVAIISGFGFSNKDQRAATIFVNHDRLPKTYKQNVGLTFVIGHELSHIFRGLIKHPTELEKKYPELLADHIDVYDFPNTLEETRADLFGWIFELVQGHQVYPQHIQNLHNGFSTDTYAAGVIAQKIEPVIRDLAQKLSDGQIDFSQAFISLSSEVLLYEEELRAWREFHKTYYTIDVKERTAMAYYAGHGDKIHYLDPDFKPNNIPPQNPLRPNPFLSAEKDHFRLTQEFLNAALHEASANHTSQPFLEFAKVQNLDMILNHNLKGWCADRLVRAAEIWNATNGDTKRIIESFNQDFDAVDNVKESIQYADPNKNLFFDVVIDTAESRYPIIRQNFLDASSKGSLLQANCLMLPDELPQDIERKLLSTKRIFDAPCTKEPQYP